MEERLSPAIHGSRGAQLEPSSKRPLSGGLPERPVGGKALCPEPQGVSAEWPATSRIPRLGTGGSQRPQTVTPRERPRLTFAKPHEHQGQIVKKKLPISEYCAFTSLTPSSQFRRTQSLNCEQQPGSRKRWGDARGASTSLSYYQILKLGCGST